MPRPEARGASLDNPIRAGHFYIKSILKGWMKSEPQAAFGILSSHGSMDSIPSYGYQPGSFKGNYTGMGCHDTKLPAHDPAVAPDGSLWYTGMRSNTLGRVNLKTEQIKEYTLRTPGCKEGIQ